MLDGSGYCPNLWDKHSYLGMSHAIIRRYLPIANSKSYVIASGAPRESLFGVVRFFSIMFDVSFGQVTKLLDVVLRGPQKGAYFGFSMAALDLNGDKHEDLIVGAPYYSRKFEPNVGAVYIYQNHKNKVRLIFNPNKAIKNHMLYIYYSTYKGFYRRLCS